MKSPIFQKKNIQEMEPTEMEQADDEFSVERVLDKRVIQKSKYGN